MRGALGGAAAGLESDVFEHGGQRGVVTAFIAAPASPECCGEGDESQQQDSGLADKTDECCAEERRTLARPPCAESLKPI